MPDLDLVTSLAIETLTHVIQTLMLLGFAGLLRFYLKSYQQAYLGDWSVACLSYGASELIRAVLTSSALIGTNYPEWITQSLYTGSIFLHYLALTYIALGAYNAIKERHLSQTTRHLLLLITTLAASATIAWMFSNQTGELSLFESELPRFIVPALLFLGIALFMFLRIPPGLGPKIVASAFTFLAIKNLILSAVLLFTNTIYLDWVISTQGLFTIVFLTIIMVGIVIWLLESERSTSFYAVQRAEYLHTHDALTGVANRHQLVSKIPVLVDYCRSNNRHLSVMLLGVSRFKSVNERLGIRGGDQVLKEIARRLQQFKRKPVTVARISGDVFAVIFDHLKSRRHIIELATELQHELSRPIEVNQRQITLSVGVGISRYPQHGVNAEILLNKATLALTDAKRQNASNITFYERGMDDAFSQLIDMEPILRKAFKNNEFVIYLQPQFDFDYQQLCGFEALIRWQHPERGLLSPAEFIPHIEQLGLTELLDNWVLERAAEILADWNKRFSHVWPIAVNLSAQQFQQSKLVEHLTRLVDNYQLDASYLELEITETVAMSDLSNGMDVIRRLRDLGFKVAIDDFGTGHSSLAYLRSLPINKIKIDRSFVSELQVNRTDATILKAMIRLAHGLGKRVIAEGIETQDQQDILQQLGCDMMQGYFYSPPIKLELAEQLIENELKLGREPLPASLATA
ncbi:MULTISPECIES: putative bifunctional diguanylate cyclase/phosphodiesterase [Idiomarina]|jgi:diguanylate cyclase (GGDEF)-like protein|uniref:Signaling protein with DMT-family integral membrane sensor domain, GGDEF and EAL domains n=1 Tax=Idiomarina baltica OS145 TaxID=314276 RepID=A0ABP2CRX1_9GAMM|nr:MULTISPECIES: GGDEF domain-containing phosphodiesterase [Idiomarina]EAQ32613.1 Signaling protein with DMT-family integral membrane sensor domain, GGDEF and EAL domains [Idiomarina baltica OS145]|tara:strand:- start:4620 stop:6686 length:2067 start_codon:yes stop_codon:yes gene_type:complete